MTRTTPVTTQSKSRYKFLLLLIFVVVINDYITWSQNRMLQNIVASRGATAVWMSSSVTARSLVSEPVPVVSVDETDIGSLVPTTATTMTAMASPSSTPLTTTSVDAVVASGDTPPITTSHIPPEPPSVGATVIHASTDIGTMWEHHNNVVVDDPILEPILAAGIMYSICGPDRSGNVIADMMYAHAFAFGHNITYGGSCCLRPIYPTNTTRHLLQALGWETLFPFRCPAGVDDVKFRHLRIDGPAMVQSLSPLLLHKDTYRIDGDKSYFQPAWRHSVETILTASRKTTQTDAVAMGASPMSATTGTTSPPETYEIAVHLRRGDVSPCTHARRYLPNSHYLALIDQYTTHAKGNHAARNGRPVHVTIYSESDTFEPFDAFRERNYTLELDTVDLGHVWKALSTANVVILSRSTFSIVPALLNPNVVVATEFMDFNPHHVMDGEFDVTMIDGWEQADPALVQRSDQIIRDMVRTQCKKT